MNSKTVYLTKLASLALAGLLAACTSAPPAEQRVRIPVFTPCVKVEISRPVYEFDRLPAMATDGKIVLALARDWMRGRAHEATLEAIVDGCR